MKARSNTEMLRALLVTPAARLLIAGVALVGVLIAATGWWLVGLAQTGSCEVQNQRELSLEELIAVKKRFMAYRKTPDEGMHISGDELAMLIEDQTAAPLYVEIDEKDFSAQLALAKQGDRCWPIQVSGSFNIDSSTAFVQPRTLQVGRIDLTEVVAGLNIELLPEHMPNSRAANLLQKTRAAELEDGGLRVELHDPDSSLFSND